MHHRSRRENREHPPVSHHHRPIIQRLLERVITILLRVMLALQQNSKFLTEVSVYEGNERNRGKNDIGDKRCDNSGEGGRKAREVSEW